MIQTLEYIEAYFENTLTAAEKAEFEARCVADEAFAKEVAFYITSRQAIKQTLLEKKKEQWAAEASIKKEPAGGKVVGFKKWLPYAVAASLLIAVVMYFVLDTKTPQQLASNYVSGSLSQLSQTMSAEKDTLQAGIEAYNNKEYKKATMLFESYSKAHPDNSDAKKYTGLAYLMQHNYAQALRHFDDLAGRQNLYSNPGLFLKAVTLLERNGPGDKEAAKELLQQVVNQKAEGRKEAAAWLEKW